MYRKCFDPISEKEANCIYRMIDGCVIPFDPNNTDYQAYLAWLAEGNTPLDYVLP